METGTAGQHNGTHLQRDNDRADDASPAQRPRSSDDGAAAPEVAAGDAAAHGPPDESQQTLPAGTNDADLDDKVGTDIRQPASLDERKAGASADCAAAAGAEVYPIATSTLAPAMHTSQQSSHLMQGWRLTLRALGTRFQMTSSRDCRTQTLWMTLLGWQGSWQPCQMQR
jgi:hypothetical protein